jgi:hypothetical protein
MVRLEQFFNASTSKRVSQLYTALTNPKKLHDAVLNLQDAISPALWEPYSLAMAQYLPAPLAVPVTFYAADHGGRDFSV